MVQAGNKTSCRDHSVLSRQPPSLNGRGSPPQLLDFSRALKPSSRTALLQAQVALGCALKCKAACLQPSQGFLAFLNKNASLNGQQVADAQWIFIYLSEWMTMQSCPFWRPARSSTGRRTQGWIILFGGAGLGKQGIPWCPRQLFAAGRVRETLWISVSDIIIIFI